MSLVQMSLSAALMIVAIIILRALTIERFPKKTFLVLWWIALLRLLIPFSIPSVMSIYSWISPDVPKAVHQEVQEITESQSTSEPVLEIPSEVLQNASPQEDAVSVVPEQTRLEVVENSTQFEMTPLPDTDIEYVEVNGEALRKASVVTSSSQLIGYYVKNDTSIAIGEMFYKAQVISKDKLIERDLERVPENFKMYWLKANNKTTYANSIYPGDKIDLWLLTKVDGKWIYEEFIKNIEVLNVKDDKGQNVFDVTSGREPAWLSFAVNTEMYTYLKKAEYLANMTIYPVPVNKNNQDEDAKTEISNQELVKIIDSLARKNPEEQSVEENNNNE